MQQVLFTVPIFQGTFPPDGIPIYGFGAMLFVTFIVVTWWGTVRAKRIGMEATKFQDFCIWVFISGIVGARVLYMIQYAKDFPNEGIGAILGSFFKIWEGGIIFYGSALGGAIGYGLFYWLVMRRLQVSGWQLADAVAPLLALGLALGRIGCYLNGCCWGQAANEEVCTVPLGAAHFPLLPAHARPLLVGEKTLQTSTGFAVETDRLDARPRVTAVEVGSPADRAGLKENDRITTVNGEPAIGEDGKNRLEVLAGNWPRGKSDLRLSVERVKLDADGKPDPSGKTEVINLPAFAPLTVGLYPTQLYETLSMVLLMLFLLAYYPFRRHDGQLMVLLMLGYALHRFVNESLRIEPSYGGGLTLSQWASIIVVAVAVAMEVYLWRVMPSRWRGESQYVAPPVGQPAPAPQGPTGPPSPPRRPPAETETGAASQDPTGAQPGKPAGGKS